MMKHRLLKHLFLVYWGTIGINAATIEIPIVKDTEDAELRVESKRMLVSSIDLELGSRQVVGLRFQDVMIPKGSTIIKAYVQFTVDKVSEEDTELIIYGEKKRYSKTFSRTTIDGRKLTKSMVQWSPMPWLIVGKNDIAQRTEDISTIIQEIVDQNGWKNNIGLFIKGRGKRVATSFSSKNFNKNSLFLHLEYQSDIELEEMEDESYHHINRDEREDESYHREAVKPAQGQAVKPAQGQAVKPAQVQVVKPAQVQVVKPAQVQVVKPAQVQAVKPVQVQAVKPVQVQAVKPAQVQSYKNRIFVTTSEELNFAIQKLQANQTIILKDGIYRVHNLRVSQPNVTIASEYFVDGDTSHIQNTKLIENNMNDSLQNSKNEYLIKGVSIGDSSNLHIIGLSLENVRKGIGFYKGGGLVDHCNVTTSRTSGSDAVSFEKVKFGGGEVKYTTMISYDDGIDLDTYTAGGGNGKFYIHHNHFKEGINDDLIEIRFQSPTGKYQIEIANNTFSKVKGNAIQLIDYGFSNVFKVSIHHNFISNSRFSGIDTTENHRTAKEHVASSMNEDISIVNNYFVNNGHHIDGGRNMQIKENIFAQNNLKDGSGGMAYGLAWIQGNSTIQNNLFYNNTNTYLNSNRANDSQTNFPSEVENFARAKKIPLK